MVNNVNLNQNLKISVKVITKSESNLLGIASLYFKTEAFGFIRVSGFRVMRSDDPERPVKGQSASIPQDIIVAPPRIQKYYVFYIDDEKEKSKQKWNLLQILIYKTYLKQKAKLEAEMESIDFDDININEIDEAINIMNAEKTIKEEVTAEEL